jgi:hypothetical protein
MQPVAGSTKNERVEAGVCPFEYPAGRSAQPSYRSSTVQPPTAKRHRAKQMALLGVTTEWLRDAF